MASRAVKLAMARKRDELPAGAKPYTTRTHLEGLRSAALTERSSFDGHWQEIADFVRPRRAKFYISDKNRGDRRNQRIIDGTATMASQTLASGLHAGLTSPARPWFKSTTLDPKLAKRRAVQEWLEEVTTRMSAVFASSNLYNSLPSLYGDMGDFGTGAMSMLPDTKDLFRTRVFPIGSYAVGVDARGIVAIFVRDSSMSVLELIEEFGIVEGYNDIDWRRFSPQVKTAWNKGNYLEQVPISWVVSPNPEYDPRSPFARAFKFSSCHFERGEGKETQFLRESGFKSFPVFVPRWDVTDDDSYGTDCPGMTALGDVKQLQSEHREKGKAIVKKVTPPMVAAPELRNAKTSVLPGDVTYVRDTQNGFRPAHEIRFDIRELREDIAEVQYRIQRSYKEDLFLMLARSDDRLGADRPTATEVVERKEEKMIALGPMLERSNDELLNPLYDRAFEMMDAAGLIPDPPEELEGVTIVPEYTSILAQAQKLVGVGAQDRLVTTVGAMVEVWPEARHKLNINRAIDNYGDMLGGDPQLIRTDEEVAELVAAEQQQAQAAQGAANAAALGKGLKDASQAKLGDGSVLDAALASGGAA